MARHRNIRKLDYSDDYEEEYAQYGRSLEEDVAVSPSTAAEFMYHRDVRTTPSLGAYLGSGEGEGEGRRVPQISPLATSVAAVTLESRSEGAATPNGRKVVAPPPGFPARPQQPSLESVAMTTRASPRSASPDARGSAGGVRVTVSAGGRRLGFTHAVVEGGAAMRSGSSSPRRSPSPSSSPNHTPTPSRLPTPQRSFSKSKHQSIDVVSEYRKRESSCKAQINLVVIGHVDAGKSTLMGHLLYLLGHVTRKAMHKNELESQKVGKSSFAFAWVLDETREERDRGITMDVAQHQFETGSKLVTLLDAPGHRDFIPNMITGAAQADVAVLVVNATVGEFEAGFEAGGQTREHALLARSLGVRQITIAVNKMDTVEWSERRFNDIQQKLKAFLKQAGFKDADVTYVPCSGLTGENLVSPPAASILTSWYKGDTLVHRIDQFIPPSRPVERPFRCCVSDIFRTQGSGINVAGRIEAGHTQQGENILVLPANEVANIKSVMASNEPALWAVAGDQVILTITGVDPSKISAGSVLCSLDNPVAITTRVQARIIVFNLDIPITLGFPVLLHYQSLNEPAVVTKLISLLHRSSGELIKKKPRCLTKNTTAVIELETFRPVCLELYQDCKELGRFMLRSRGSTIAAGVVTKIL